MLWGYEISSETGYILGDEGDYAFETKQDAMMDALNYAKTLIRDYPDKWTNGISITLQEIDESMVEAYNIH